MFPATAYCLFATLAPGATDAQESVEAGRRGLDHWWRYPWYDSASDDVRPIDVSEPRYLRWDWLDFDWTWPRISWGSLPSMDTLLQWLAWLTIALVLLFLVVVLVRTYLRRTRGGQAAGARPRQDTAEKERRRIESLPFPLRAAQSDLLAEARRCRREGRYGEAIKFLFSHELVQLDKHQFLRLARGKTNRQYLRELGGGALAGLLENTMIVFEDFFFGNYAIDRARFEACWGELERFETLVEARP